MRDYKYTKAAGIVLFISGAVFSYFAFGKSDLFYVVTLILLFLLSGIFIGQEIVYEKYDHLHYTALEDDAKKRRDKDRIISEKVAADIEQDDKNHQDIE
ncbi:MAG TPA: hypothetical protein PKA38_05420 [Candidatus Levybacteria bacterium]|nr:hypothetical protein [Candidatus Levybacteria bacterium]